MTHMAPSSLLGSWYVLEDTDGTAMRFVVVADPDPRFADAVAVCNVDDGHRFSVDRVFVAVEAQAGPPPWD